MIYIQSVINLSNFQKYIVYEYVKYQNYAYFQIHRKTFLIGKSSIELAKIRYQPYSERVKNNKTHFKNQSADRQLIWAIDL